MPPQMSSPAVASVTVVSDATIVLSLEHSLHSVTGHCERVQSRGVNLAVYHVDDVPLYCRERKKSTRSFMHPTNLNPMTSQQ